MWIFQLKFIPIVYKELIIHRIKKEFNHKKLLVLLVMVQQGTACRYPALLLTFSYQLSILAENILSFICCSISSIPYVSSIYS